MTTMLANELIGVPPPALGHATRRATDGPSPVSPRLEGPMLVASADPATLDGALHVAQLLARRDRVNVHVLGIVPPLPVQPRLLSPADHQALEEGRRYTHRTVLRRHVHQAVGRPVHFSTGAETGRAQDAIGRAARARRSALILVGLERKGTPQRAPTEQLALRAAAAADVPVLAVPVDCVRLPRRALVAVDFSAASIRAAAAAIVAVRGGGHVTLAHVEPSRSVIEDRHDLDDDAVLHLFGDMLRELPVRDDVSVDALLLQGAPVPALLEVASTGDYDLIATGSRANARSEFRLAGGVCKGLLAEAMDAVLIAPPP